MHSDVEPIEEVVDVGNDASKHSDVDTNSDIGGAASQRVRGSISGGIFDGCGTEQTAAETSSCSGKTVNVYILVSVLTKLLE